MKKQLNVRVSEATEERIKFLAKKYGTKTAVIEVAITLLYTQFVNTESPTDAPPKRKGTKNEEIRN